MEKKSFENILERLNCTLVFCVILCLPFSIPHFNLLGFVSILVSANMLLRIFLGYVKIIIDVKLLILISLYLIYIPGIFYSENKAEAFHQLERKLSFLLFPILFSCSPQFSSFQIRKLLLGFVSACAMSAIYALSVGLWHYIVNNDSAYLFYRILSGTLGMHAIYLSMYYCFAIGILMVLFFDGASGFGILEKTIYFLSFLLLALTIVLLSGRVSIFVLIVGTMVFIFLQLKKKHSTFRAILIATFVGAFIFALALVPSRNRARLKEAINYKNQYSISASSGPSGAVSRPFMWACALKLVAQNPFIGVGSGDVQLELNQCYKDENYDFLLTVEDMQFNAHNQFLEVAVGLGLSGFLIFLYFCFRIFKIAVSSRNIIYLIFLVSFFISCLTESILERQSGIAFFAFFNSLFYFNDLGYKKNRSHSRSTLTAS